MAGEDLYSYHNTGTKHPVKQFPHGFLPAHREGKIDLPFTSLYKVKFEIDNNNNKKGELIQPHEMHDGRKNKFYN